MLRVLFISSFFTIQLLSFAAFSESDTFDLEKIIVTGSHTPITTEEIGSSYTVITEEDIERRQSVFVSDLLRDVPGFAVSRSGAVGSQVQVRVRGAEANQLLVLIDGVEANDIAGGDEFNFAHLVTNNIERIEIIRGSQSALYGSDALAGVVNIITKKGIGAATLSTYVEGGSFGTSHAGAGISGSGKIYQFSLQGSYLKTDGINIASSGDEEDGYKNGTISFSAAVNPLESLKFDISGRHTDAQNDTDIQSATSVFIVDASHESEISQDYLRGQATFGFFDQAWEHTLGTAITNTDNDFLEDGSETNNSQGKKLRFDYKTNLYFDTAGPADAAHALTFGIDHEKDFFKQEDSKFRGLSNQERRAKTTGIFAGHHVNLWERLFLSIGVRHDDNSDFKNATTHRSTIAYRVLDWDSKVHASYGTGIKRPTFVDRFGFFPGPLHFIGNPDIKSEKSKGWDFGIEKSLSNGRVNIGMTYFRARLEDEIVLTGFPLTSDNSDAISKRQGIEINTSTDLTENLFISAAYTWLDATQPNTLDRQIKEVRRPEHTANINLHYNFPNNRANANLNVSFTDNQIDTVFLPVAPFTRTRVSLSGYTLINLAGSYKITDKFSLYGRINNLLDKNYQDVFSFQTPGISGIVGVKVALQP